MKLFISITLLVATTVMVGKAQLPYENNNGKKLFEKKCVRCHGTDGTRGLIGAKNLQKTTLTDEQYLYVVSNGRKVMPSWKNKLSTDEINQIITYIKTLRK